jgi:hypothetical protein
MTKDLNCVANLQSGGGLTISDKGFCLSTTDPFPTMSSDIVWSVPGAITPPSDFSDNVSGLTEITWYYVRAYAINSIGVAYSNVIQQRTGGLVNYPTITCYITDNFGIPRRVYEMGTSTNITVSGETVKNDETIFNGGKVDENWITNQTILTWPPPSTYLATYTINRTFSPIGNIQNQKSWTMTDTATAYCGSPQYNITGTDTIEAVFPFIWSIRSTTIGLPTSFFTANSCVSPPPTNYFYEEASNFQLNQILVSGKSIIKKPAIGQVITLTMWPHKVQNVDLKYLVFGYPSSYGTGIQFSLDNVLWGHPIITTQTVGSGNIVANCWAPTGGYNTFLYTFPDLTSTPINFYFKFTS